MSDAELKAITDELTADPGHPSSPQLDDLLDDELLDEAAVCRDIGGEDSPIHRSTLWRGIHDGRYPPPLKLGKNTNRWLKSEVRAVRARAIAARGSEAA